MSKIWRILGLVLIVIVALLAVGYWQKESLTKQAFAPNEPAAENTTPITESLPEAEEAPQEDISVISSSLNIPWEIAFLPGGDLLVTERPGNLLRIGKDKSVIKIDGVRHAGEGGLLGLALHPSFSSNGLIYLYLTSSSNGGITNRVEQYKLSGTTLSNRKVILDNIPGSFNHDGGRIAFGPTSAKATAGKPAEFYLYITTGDAGNEPAAQDTNSLAGKILRLKDDGSVPSDNPFNSPVYSYGHRNPQGLAWSGNQLWASEHGRSGVRTGFDEVNLIEKGANYGWPTIQGDEEREGMRKPTAHSGSNTTWAPSGAIFYKGDLLFAGLRGESLYKADINGNTAASVKALFAGQFGRLRTVTVGPDGQIYILTNNRDGRGTPNEGDDKIIRINPALLSD